MKVLTMFVEEFSYKPALKNLDLVEEVYEPGLLTNSILAFIQVEQTDEMSDVKSREKKLVNHLKWVSRKNDCKSVISDSKASPKFSKEVMDEAEKRLKNAEFQVIQTPFGYFLDLNIKAPGFSLARIWADL